MDNASEKSLVPLTMENLEDLDISIIDDMPWAKQLWAQIQQDTQKGFLNWCKMVKKLVGIKAEHVEGWSESYRTTIGETCCDMVVDLDHLHTKTIDKIQELLGHLEKLCVELHLKMPSKIGKNELSLFEEQNSLMRKVKEYEAVIDAKRKEIETLQEKQRRLCKHLGKEPKVTLQYPPLPTPDQLEHFHKIIDQLETEKFEREEKFCTLKEDIMAIVNDLKYKPSTEFEKNVFSSDKFLVTTDNLKELEFFHKNLKGMKKSTEEEISQLRCRIEDLWKMLDVDLMYRDEFRSRYTGNSLDTLDALRVEVKKCEVIRKTNIQIFIDKLRKELQDVWVKCHCADGDKKFKYFNSACYTEDLLDLHEMEIQKWKHYYTQNKKLLGLLEKHSELWEKVIELEENATGPNRYENRGGKLLREEKERNKLSKLIPKIEEDILFLSEDFKSRNGIDFLTYGRTPEEYIAHMHEDRENARKQKLSVRKLQRAITPGKSPVSLFPSTSTAITPTPLSATKRKILATPNTNTKRLKVNTPMSVAKPKTPAVPIIKVTHATLPLSRQKRRSRSSMERRKRLDNIRKTRRSRDVSNRNDAETTNNTTYTDFQSELSSRDEKCRSTILPEQILRISAISSPKRKTPVRTPLRTPANPRTPRSRTPKSRDGENTTKLSACRSKLKLLF